jgi:hypothetical protein
MIKVLFELVQEYYWPAMEPVYEILSKDSNYDLRIKIGPNQKRFLGVLLLSQKAEIEARFREKGIQTTDETSGFDIVICGDTLKYPERYGKAFMWIMVPASRHCGTVIFSSNPILVMWCLLKGSTGWRNWQNMNLTRKSPVSM